MARTVLRSEQVDGEPDVSYDPYTLPDLPTTSPCDVPEHRRGWHFADSIDDRQRTECALCRKHWWTRYAQPIEGAPFTPYFVQCEAMGLSGRDRLEWLREQPVPAPGLLKTATRFNYWRKAGINPLWGHAGLDPWHVSNVESRAHALLSDRYEYRHKAGDGSAIFEFVSVDVYAFQSTWVTNQITDWRLANSRQSLAAARKLMMLYTDNAKVGDRSKHLPLLASRIRRDQTLFRHLYTRHVVEGVKLESVLSGAQDKMAELCGEQFGHYSTLDVWRKYRVAFDGLADCAGGKSRVFELLEILVSRIEQTGGTPLPT